MVSVGNAIFAQLSTATAVATITTVILPNYAPKSSTYPQVIFEKKQLELDKVYSGNSGLAKAEVVVKCLTRCNFNTQSAGYSQCDALANAVTAAIDQQKGTWGGVVIQGAFLNDDTEDQYPSIESEEIQFFIRELTFEVWFQTG